MEEGRVGGSGVNVGGKYIGSRPLVSITIVLACFLLDVMICLYTEL